MGDVPPRYRGICCSLHAQGFGVFALRSPRYTERQREEESEQRMIRSAASKVMWVGRATVFLVGLAVILALVVGAAGTAFGANLDNFILGQINKATAVTQLNGNVPGGPALQVNNTRAEGGSKALQITVAQNRPPIQVNSTAGKATNLNADQLDGRDHSEFVTNATYTKTLQFQTNGGGSTNGNGMACDDGDVLLSGGVKLNTADHQQVVESRPMIPDPGGPKVWFGSVRDTAAPSGTGYEITILCGDLGASRTE